MNSRKIKKILNYREIEIHFKSEVKFSSLPLIKSSEEAAEYLRGIFNPNTIGHRESFNVVLLNTSCRVIGHFEMSKGGIDATMIDVRLIMQSVLLANATQIILSHNHPSGALEPSEADMNATERIVECCELFSIRVLDHIILTREGFISFRLKDLL